MNNITAIILTKNEEVNIERCISSIVDFVDRIIVVDSGSTDKTIDIAKKLGAEIYSHKFIHYANQFNWALDNTNIKTTWVYRIDADECVPVELAEEIVEKCKLHENDDINGFLMKHKICFMNKHLKHGGTYPFIKMTVFKPEFGRFEDRAMGEHIVLKSGKSLTLENDCIHYDYKDLTSFIEKHNLYSSREVIDYFDRNDHIQTQATLYNNAEKTKKIRDSFYYKLPKFFRAKLYYCYRYYIKLGFLDGTPGKIYAFIQAYMYRYMVDAKIYERENNER